VAIYENDVIAAMAVEATSMSAPVTYVDCGADIGLFASKVALHVPNIGQIVALEPNSAVREYLGRNLLTAYMFRHRATARRLAISTATAFCASPITRSRSMPDSLSPSPKATYTGPRHRLV
jgi:FkbM family methyltransferase